MTWTQLLAQSNGEDAAAATAVGIMCCCYISVIVGSLATVLFQIAGQWAVFDKAGKPGWAAIIPIYNLIVWAEVAKKEAWFGLLCLIPGAGIVFMFILSIETAKQFGKDAGYGVGLALLPFIFWPMLGFGKSRYVGGQQQFVPVNRPPGGGWQPGSGPGPKQGRGF